MKKTTHDFLNLWQELSLIQEDFLEKLEALVSDYKREVTWFKARADKKIKETTDGLNNDVR